MLKLNNKGWGLQTMMLFIIILMIALVVIYVMIEKNFSYLMGYNYQKEEIKVVEALKKYYKENDISINNEEEKIISVKKLKNEGLLENFNKCSGYGLLKKTKNKISYNVFLRCGNEYTTDGYINYLDEI